MPDIYPSMADPHRTTREARFEHLWDAHYDLIYAYVLRRAPGSADEVTAEVFAVAWRRLDSIDAGNALPWLYGVARNTLMNNARSARRRVALLERLEREAVTDPPAPWEPAGESSSGIVGQLARLSERDREVLLLVAWEGLDTRGVARALGCSVATARVRLHRARARLRRASAHAQAGDDARTPEVHRMESA